LEAWERRAEIASNTITPDQYSYSPEEDFYPPPSYSPVTYDLDPLTPLEIPQIEIEIPIATIDIEYSYTGSIMKVMRMILL